MEGSKNKSLGKIPRASLVLAFVKKDELYRFVNEGQPVRAIARYYDRSEDLVGNAIEALQKYEAQFAANDIVGVAREAWGNRLGWERTDSFLAFRDFISRGELMPKDTCGPKRRVRRKTSATEPQPLPVQPAAVVKTPMSAPVMPAPQVKAPPAANEPPDELTAALQGTGLMQKTARVSGQNGAFK